MGLGLGPASVFTQDRMPFWGYRDSTGSTRLRSPWTWGHGRDALSTLPVTAPCRIRIISGELSCHPCPGCVCLELPPASLGPEQRPLCAPHPAVCPVLPLTMATQSCSALGGLCSTKDPGKARRSSGPFHRADSHSYWTSGGRSACCGPLGY